MIMPDVNDAPVVRTWIAGKVPAAAAALIERLRRAPDVARIAVLPDVHAATDACVGCAVATRRLIYPAAVGGDIGCGLATVPLDAGPELLDDQTRATALLAGLRGAVPTNRHRRPQPLPRELIEAPLADDTLSRVRRDAAVQFGTLGRGNHFLEFQADEQGRLWVMVHSGSRAVGPALRDHYVARGEPTAAGIAALEADSAPGRGYLADAAWAVSYAAASRRATLDATVALLWRLFRVHAPRDTLIECDHNHVRRETHFDEPLWVHRKGAAPAAAGASGLIPGSMGTRTFHVEGRGEPESLCSSSHGAGRALSRNEARRRIGARDVHRQLRGVWFDPATAEHLRDEAPAAYKDIAQVMRAQRDLVRIVRTLRPLLSYKG
jgi:tRNA-splicing ligase RtcB